MKSKLFYIQLFGILSLILILLIVVPIYRDKIPKKLTFEVRDKLQKKGLNWVAVRAKGRDIVLSGLAPTIEDHKEAVFIAEHVIGVRLVDDKISPTVTTPYTMRMEYRDKELIFKGYMPSKESMHRFFNKVQESYPHLKIIKKVDIGSGEPKEWESLVSTISLLFKELDIAVVNIVDRQVSFSGKCQTTEQEEEIHQYLNEFRDIGFVIQSHIIAMDETWKVCQKNFNKLLSKQKIEFEIGKSTVKAKNQLLLKGLADISFLCPNAKMDVIGHTDNRGNDLKNRELSKARAKAVIAKLFQLGIPLDQMSAVGKGESEPLFTNETADGRAKNRRIEFKVRGE